MHFLDYDKLNAIDTTGFLETKPYPFVNPLGVLTDQGYDQLMGNLPDVSVMVPSFGKRRSHGQVSHDRYALEYDNKLQGVSGVWHEFVAELRGPDYSAFIRRMFQRRSFHLNMHWHYAPRGCSVSPHCDASHKLGSHLFYMNDVDIWQREWGGGTLILDDQGQFHHNSAPDFSDFSNSIESECAGNYSTLFARRNQSWHGVREIQCPDDQLRKVFIIVINQPVLYAGRQVLKWLQPKKNVQQAAN